MSTRNDDDHRAESPAAPTPVGRCPTVAVSLNDTANLATFLLDAHSEQLLAIDDAAAARYKLIPAHIANFVPRTLFPHLTDEQWATLLLDLSNRRTRSCTTLVKDADGSEQRARVLVTPLTDGQKRVLLLTIQSLVVQVDRDALTGLPDRREIARHYERWRSAHNRNSPALALLFMDLDEFKQVNDQYGHAVGDQVLVELADRWQGCVRDGDLVARYGGDEFVVLLAGIPHSAAAEPVVARLTQATTHPISVAGQQLTVGMTVGVAFADNGGPDLEQLITTADRNMYAAKRCK